MVNHILRIKLFLLKEGQLSTIRYFPGLDGIVLAPSIEILAICSHASDHIPVGIVMALFALHCVQIPES